MKLIKDYKKFQEAMAAAPEAPQGEEMSIPGESSGEETTLYRLTHSTVDLSSPGEYYVKSLEDVNPEFLDDKEGELFLMTVTCDSGNIDSEKSAQECEQLGCDCVVAVKDASQCKIVSVEPYKSEGSQEEFPEEDGQEDTDM